MMIQLETTGLIKQEIMEYKKRNGLVRVIQVLEGLAEELHE